jgi:hypothetical protein
MRIRGIDNLSTDEIRFEVQRGGKFVLYSYCVSVVVLTFRRTSDVYFLRSGESPVVKGLPWTLLTVLLGWWGIPWGPIYSIQSLILNLSGGKDVTSQLVSIRAEGAGSSATAAQ